MRFIKLLIVYRIIKYLEKLEKNKKMFTKTHKIPKVGSMELSKDLNKKWKSLLYVVTEY